MSKSRTINIYVKRTGAQLTVPVTDNTTIAKLIEFACEKEKLPRERYELVINDSHLLKEASTVAIEKLFDLAPTDRIVLTMKGSYKFIEAQMLVKLRDERIAALTAKAKAEANEPAVNQVPKVKEEIANTAPPKRTETPAKESTVQTSGVESGKATVEQAKSGIAVDLEGVARGIDQFPQGLVQDYVHAALTEFNIMLVGAPGTGKRTLISAICGVEIKRLSILADPGTDESKPYTVEHSYNTEKKLTKCKVNFWSTRGIEEWSDSNIQQYVDKIKAKKNLLCMIFCISPNTFADPDKIEYILAKCVQARIFSALVVTNMYVGPAANELLEMFKTMLAHHSEVTREDDSITYYGHVGLFVKVNSVVFTTQNGTEYPVKGVDELTLAITQSLSPEKAMGWGLLLVENGPFWLRNHAKIFKLLDVVKDNLPSWW